MVHGCDKLFIGPLGIGMYVLKVYLSIVASFKAFAFNFRLKFLIYIYYRINHVIQNMFNGKVNDCCTCSSINNFKIYTLMIP